MAIYRSDRPWRQPRGHAGSLQGPFSPGKRTSKADERPKNGTYGNENNLLAWSDPRLGWTLGPTPDSVGLAKVGLVRPRHAKRCLRPAGRTKNGLPREPV